MNKLQTKILAAIKSVLVIHENQKDKTDKLAAEKVGKIAEEHAIQFMTWEKNQTKFKSLSDNKRWAITLPATKETDLLLSFDVTELYEYWLTEVHDKN